MRRLRIAVLLVLVHCGLAAAHEITFSHVELRLSDAATLVSIQLPVTALLQEEPTSLPPGTTGAELGADPIPPDVTEALTELVVARLRITAADALRLSVESIAPSGTDIAVTATAPPVSGPLTVEANLFPTDTLHKVFVTVYRGETLAGQYALDAINPGFILAGPERPVLEVVASFIGEGIHHIFIGTDHILFVIGLILLGGRLWSQAKIITAFTVAHSITLTLAALGLVALPSRLVESVIALSIVVVGLHDLWQLRRSGVAGSGRDPRMLLAFGFGLVHGFGFASVLSELDLPASALAWSLAAFNFGVELGQLTIVLLAAPVLIALRRYAPGPVSAGVLSAAATMIVAAGSFWLWQRATG